MNRILQHVAQLEPLDDQDALALSACGDLALLMPAAQAIRDAGHGSTMSYSRKVFIPLTKLCRDVCHYCTFAKPPSKTSEAFLNLDQVLDIARAGAAAGCKEALFTLGDKPELRYRAARDGLAELGHDTTLSYLAEAASAVFRETGLLPHINAGVMNRADIEALRNVSVSQGIMLESISERLCEKGGVHYGSPDKQPSRRLASINDAGLAQVPFTSGLLIGIGETRRERIEALLALRSSHDTHGHIQEIIIQPFRAKPDTLMAHAMDAPLDELLWTCAMARIILGSEANIQAPPNLAPGALARLVDAGLNDWGGISPVTPDHVNPEAPWPHLDALRAQTEAAGKVLVERLGIYPAFVHDEKRWLAADFHTAVKQAVDAQGLARMDPWSPGLSMDLPQNDAELAVSGTSVARDSAIAGILGRAKKGTIPNADEIVRLFAARGQDFAAVCTAADDMRQEIVGDEVTYVITRNINYTNICSYKCQFCAFSKGKLSENLRGRPYDLDIAEILKRAGEARARGATELCMQGGIHPHYTGDTYANICRAIKAAYPDLHIHALSPLEIEQGAATLGLDVKVFLSKLMALGLGSLPGTAAEILDDDIRAIICPDKINTQQWLSIMETAHELGLRSTSTIMFGHVEQPRHWARHLLRLRALQERTGGFTEFVPLPFVHMETPIYLKGRARRGPTFRESILMHAIARLVFQRTLPNIQASWVKMGEEGVKLCLQAGANDAGGTLMNETITRSAGAAHGQEMTPERMEAMIQSIGRVPEQRTTLYRTVPREPLGTGFNASALNEQTGASPGLHEQAALYLEADYIEPRIVTPGSARAMM